MCLLLCPLWFRYWGHWSSLGICSSTFSLSISIFSLDSPLPTLSITSWNRGLSERIPMIISNWSTTSCTANSSSKYWNWEECWVR